MKSSGDFGNVSCVFFIHSSVALSPKAARKRPLKIGLFWSVIRTSPVASPFPHFRQKPKFAEIREITLRDRSKAIVAKGSGQVSEVLHASSEKKRSLGVLMRMRETL